MKNIADMYLEGLGVEKSLTEAEKWLRMAAEKGNEEAGKELSSLLGEG